MRRRLVVGAACAVAFAGVTVPTSAGAVGPARGGAGLALASSSPVAVENGQPVTLDRTTRTQPMVTSAYGGAAARRGKVDGRPRVVIVRFVDGRLERASVDVKGGVQGVQIDDSGRITVVVGANTRPTCLLSAVTWRPGQDPSPVRQIGEGFFCPSPGVVPTLIDSAGDVAVIDRFPDDHYTVITLPAGRGWQDPVSVPIQSAARGTLLAIDLSPAGNLVGLWSDRNDLNGELTLTRRALEDSAWTSTRSLGPVGSSVYGGSVDAGPAGNVGFLVQGRGAAHLGRVGAAGDVTIEEMPSTVDASVRVLSAGDPRAVRCIVDRHDVLTQQYTVWVGEITDGGFSNSTLMTLDTTTYPGFPTYAVNSLGDIAVSRVSELDGQHDFDLYRWPAAGPVQRSPVAFGPQLRAVAPVHLLDSGRLWWHAFRVGADGTYHPLYLLGRLSG